MLTGKLVELEFLRPEVAVKPTFLTLVLLIFAVPLIAQEEHNHPAPEQLGRVVFPTSCSKAVQPQFDRAVALLHSFAYADAEKGFRQVIAADPKCAIARWGVAMSFYHQLWEPWITPAHLTEGAAELEEARKLTASPRERQFIDALDTYYRDPDKSTPQARAAKYQAAMKQVAQSNPKDIEAQVFYALALVANASPMDQTYTAQKEAAAILEPLYKQYPDHPGIPHYLIHAYDNSQLAARGLPAARSIPRSRLPHLTHSTCLRTFSRASAIGMTRSIPISPHEPQPINRETSAKNSTRWTISPMHTCNADKPQRL